MAVPREGDPRGPLLGILALVNGFIDREALTGAFGVWSTERSRSLGDILVERQAITPAHRQLLEQLALSIAERHGDDPQSGLSAVTAHVSEEDRTVLETLDQDALRDLRQSLAQLKQNGLDGMGSDSTEEQEELTAGFRSQAPPSDDAACRYVRGAYLRGGGLGQIHKALDREFGRLVAFKTIRPEYVDHPVMREKFVLEAEVTGNLEHPGIVPAYGLGTYAGGHPYYAMRLVKGANLRERLDAFHLSPAESERSRQPANLTAASQPLRELLRHFASICLTLEYAHSRGVVHRDLKPSNLMLGQFGETLVIDWGLAKALGRRLPEDVLNAVSQFEPHLPGTASTHPTLGQVGTPGYMPPEQYDRPGVATTPASDIYALGAVLYEIVTGRGPFEHLPRDERRAATLSGDFRPPRDVNSTVPRALEAICLKAMSVEPDRRYASARALSDDVTRWLEDEPVTALPEGWSDRLGRWERKHRQAVRVGALGLAVVALVSTLSALLVSGLKGRSDWRLNQLLGMNNQVLIRSTNLQIEHPVTHGYVEQIASDQIHTLEDLLHDTPNDVRIHLGLGRSQALKARSRIVGEASSRADTSIRESFQKARESLQRCVIADESNRLELAGLLLDEALWALEIGPASRVRQSLDEAGLQLNRIAELPEMGSSAAYLVRRVDWHKARGSLDLLEGEAERAFAELQRARDLLAPGGRIPGSELLRIALADTWVREARLRHDLGEREKAISPLRQALLVNQPDEARTAAEPLDPEIDARARLLLAACDSSLITAEQLADIEAGIDLFSRFYNASGLASDQRALAWARLIEAEIRSVMNDQAREQVACKHARALLDDLAERHDLLLSDWQTLGRLSAHEGELHQADGRQDEAEQSWQAASVAHQRVLATFPSSPTDRTARDQIEMRSKPSSGRESDPEPSPETAPQ